MRFPEARELVRSISFRGMFETKLRVQLEEDPCDRHVWRLMAELHVENLVLPNNGESPGVVSYRRLPSNPPREYLLNEVRRVCQDLLLHELDECLTLDSELVFDPHAEKGGL